MVLAVLLAVDYRREMTEALAEQQQRLSEEAMSMYRGLFYLAQNDRPEDVQRFIDSVCSHLQQSQSPGHSISVTWNGGRLQSSIGSRLSPEMLSAVETAARDGAGAVSDGVASRIVGRYSGHGVTVHVSELTTNIRRSIRRNIFFHLASLIVLAAVAAVLVSVVLWRIVVYPLKALSASVTRIADRDFELDRVQFQSTELNDLAEAVYSMSVKLAENERSRQSQMSRARRIQEALLPTDLQITGGTIVPLFKPAEDVAGDYYDVIPLSDGTHLICLADVAGHGIPAAICAAVLKTVLVNAAEHATAPGAILDYVNSRLVQLLPDQFASMFLAKWDSTIRRLTYASAGHEPGIHLRGEDDVRLLPATGLLLGIDCERSYETESIELSASDRVLLVTDGVTESHSPTQGMFGRERLIQLAKDCLHLTATQSIAAIGDAVREQQSGENPTDDITVVLIELSEKTSRVCCLT
ncbi:MAG: serine/threonine-protein phosphatase [Planctomycetes bacterium]|nr:serine/threonine-protein phosphatase [Planctomycetota bacterium]